MKMPSLIRGENESLDKIQLSPLSAGQQPGFPCKYVLEHRYPGGTGLGRENRRKYCTAWHKGKNMCGLSPTGETPRNGEK